jgi:hypothetical protein
MRAQRNPEQRRHPNSIAMLVRECWMTLCSIQAALHVVRFVSKDALNAQ